MKAQNKTMKTIITSNSRLLRRAFCTLLLCIAGLWAMPTSAHAQLYVSQVGNGTVGDYNVTTGAAISSSFIIGLSDPDALALSGNTLFVATQSGGGVGTVGAYDATTGAAINASFITAGNFFPSGLAVSGNNLFVSDATSNGTIGEYNATTGATISASFTMPAGVASAFTSLAV